MVADLGIHVISVAFAFLAGGVIGFLYARAYGGKNEQ